MTNQSESYKEWLNAEEISLKNPGLSRIEGRDIELLIITGSFHGAISGVNMLTAYPVEGSKPIVRVYKKAHDFTVWTPANKSSRNISRALGLAAAFLLGSVITAIITTMM